MPSQQLPLVNQREPLPPLMHFSLRFSCAFLLSHPSLLSSRCSFPPPFFFFFFFFFKSCTPFSLSLSLSRFPLHRFSYSFFHISVLVSLPLSLLPSTSHSFVPSFTLNSHHIVPSFLLHPSIFFLPLAFVHFFQPSPRFLSSFHRIFDARHSLCRSLDASPLSLSLALDRFFSHPRARYPSHCRGGQDCR